MDGKQTKMFVDRHIEIACIQIGYTMSLMN